MAQSQKSLNAVFTDVANAIRTKAGTNQTIAPIDFADEILKIGSSEAVLDIITNGVYNVLAYGSVNVKVAGDTSPQFFPPKTLSVDFVKGTLTASEDASNGAFTRAFRYYLDDDIIYQGENTKVVDFYDYIKKFGDQTFSVSIVGPLFEESSKLSCPFNIKDKGGYFTYLDTSNHTCAKFLTTYHIEQNEFGQSVVLDEEYAE